MERSSLGFLDTMKAFFKVCIWIGTAESKVPNGFVLTCENKLFTIYLKNQG